MQPGLLTEENADFLVGYSDPSEVEQPIMLFRLLGSIGFGGIGLMTGSKTHQPSFPQWIKARSVAQR